MIETIRARLEDLTGPEPDEVERAVMLRLLRSYAEKTPAALTELAATVAAGDPAAVGEVAHRLKGSASNVGADRFAGILAEVEGHARDGRLSDANERLQAEWVTLARELNTMIGELQA